MKRRKKPSSLTPRTLAHLRSFGWIAEVVEKWNPFARVRQDLFGVIDIVACTGDKIIGVQSTAFNSKSARLAKIRESEKATAWLKSGGHLWLISWKKVKVKKGGKAFRYEPDIFICETGN